MCCLLELMSAFMCRALRPGQYSRQQLMFLEKCNSEKLRSIAGPFRVKFEFWFNQQQQFEMVARGKPFRMNDFLNSFEEKFGQPSFVERSFIVPLSALCPVPLHNLPFPKALLDFAKGQLTVCFSLAAMSECVCVYLETCCRTMARRIAHCTLAA